MHVDPGAVLIYLTNNPGSSGEQVAEAMGTDTATVRPVVKKLIADGAVAAHGKGRGMRYARV
jgi:DNA-binding MarR family transcriptional regulator